VAARGLTVHELLDLPALDVYTAIRLNVWHTPSVLSASLSKRPIPSSPNPRLLSAGRFCRGAAQRDARFNSPCI
jgi:hypothetical protein